jgi:hypothetical protein
LQNEEKIDSTPWTLYEYRTNVVQYRVTYLLLFPFSNLDWIFVARATCSWLFSKKNNIQKFQNNLKTNMDVVNDVFYQPAKFELGIPYIWGCTKINK